MDEPNIELATGLVLPSFEPHITLGTFPSTTPIDKLKDAIPPNTHPLPIHFSSVRSGDHYFRSVYVKIKLTEELSRLHAHIHDTLGLSAKTPEFPHLSLFYVSDDYASERERMANRLTSSGCVRSSAAEAVELVVFSSQDEKDNGQGLQRVVQGFEAPEIWIVQCEGPVESWVVLDRVSLRC